MKDFGFRELFCEILTGCALIGAVLPLWILTHDIAAQQMLENAAQLSSPGLLTLVIVVAYLLGVLFDAVGLAIGELWIDRLACREVPSEADRKAFWAAVPAQVLDYRDRQWAFYACYRNLLVLVPVAAFLWTWVMLRESRPILAIVVLVAAFILERSLFLSIRALLQLYYLITRSYTHAQPAQLPGQGSADWAAPLNLRCRRRATPLRIVLRRRARCR